MRSRMLTHKELRARAFERDDINSAYDRLDEEFAFWDEFLQARSCAGITQAEVAERIGTTQSAIARLESGGGRHSPSLATLQKYACALGCCLEFRLVNDIKIQKKMNALPPGWVSGMLLFFYSCCLLPAAAFNDTQQH